MTRRATPAIALASGLALSGYAVSRVGQSPVLLQLAIWFVGAIVVHDAVLLPAYTLADRLLIQATRRSRGADHRPPLPWINHVRVPALLSGLLLLVWFPLVLRLSPSYQRATGRSDAPYLWRWLAITAALAALSAATYLIRTARSRRQNRP